MKKSLIIFFAFYLTISFIFGFMKSKNNDNSIRISGSNSMLHLNKLWAESYNLKRQNFKVQTTGGGSGIGIASLIWELSDIAAVSRKLSEKEINKTKEKNINPIEIPVAYDAIAVAVHPSNPIDYLTIEEIALIFSGLVKNWKTINGKDAEINLYGREISSGTYELFKDFLTKKNINFDYTDKMQTLQGAFAVAKSISRDPNSIGFSGLGNLISFKGIKILGIIQDEIKIFPIINNTINYDAIRKGEYSFSRKVYFYFSSFKYHKVKDFVDYDLSKEGQSLCLKADFIPIININSLDK